MVFSSLLFLFIFLPLTIIAYYFSPMKIRNIILLLASLFFYAWGEPQYIVLMIISIIINYIAGFFIQRSNNKAPLIIGIILNVLILGYFKYVNFLIDNVNNVLSMHIEYQDLPLPIGISFYTFQSISYLVDVYRKDTPAQKNLINLALYISLFPQLVAGPIVRYKEINEQLKERVHSIEMFYQGIKIFLIGLAKKVIIANQMGLLADSIFDQSAGEMTSFIAWLGVIAYALQIYFDFCGYSEMAIGLGRMFGFHFPKNFNYPYISKNVSEFWRRWHITLGSFFRDYIYIPLGGNRVAKWKVYRNLFIVWFLTGLWHGAAWNFIIWGLFYGMIIALERTSFGTLLKKTPVAVQHIYTILLFLIGWVFFRSPDLTYSFEFLTAMFSFDFSYIGLDAVYYFKQYGFLLVVSIVASTPLVKKLMNQWNFKYKFYVELLFLLFILFVSVAFLMTSSYNPFIYYRF